MIDLQRVRLTKYASRLEMYIDVRCPMIPHRFPPLSVDFRRCLSIWHFRRYSTLYALLKCKLIFADVRRSGFSVDLNVFWTPAELRRLCCSYSFVWIVAALQDFLCSFRCASVFRKCSLNPAGFHAFVESSQTPIDFTGCRRFPLMFADLGN